MKTLKKNLNDVNVHLNVNLKKYDIKNRNDMTCIHNNEVNKISEWNLLHDIINPTKQNKKLNIHYYPILNVCINTRINRAKLKNFQILLDSGCSYKIVTGKIVEKLHP